MKWLWTLGSTYGSANHWGRHREEPCFLFTRTRKVAAVNYYCCIFFSRKEEINKELQ